MTEKKIDLSNVKVGGKLWTIQEGDTECQRVDNDDQPIVTSDDEYFMLDGKKYDDDKYPSCYHSYQEFLEFHNIAPVRMTEKELKDITHNHDYDCLSTDEVFEKGFLLAGGQIIEEPKNLPCPVCGKEPYIDIEGNSALCPNKICLMYENYWSIQDWNDPSKRGRK